MNKELSIIIVSYNAREWLFGCLNSVVLNAKAIDHEIIVVDNDSSDGSAVMVAESFPDVRLIRNEVNAGFSRANNTGIKISSGRQVLFLNPDTLVLPDSLQKMLEFSDSRDSIGIVGPRLFLDKEKRTLQLSAERFISPALVLFSYIPPVGRFITLYNRYFLNNGRAKPVDWVTGAALLVKRDLLDRIGFFDENLFMYAEDADLCFRAKRSGYEVYYYPQAEIVHFKGRSAAVVKMGNKHYWISMIYYLKKHFGTVYLRLFKFLFRRLIQLKILLHIYPSREYCVAVFEALEKIS